MATFRFRKQKDGLLLQVRIQKDVYWPSLQVRIQKEGQKSQIRIQNEGLFQEGIQQNNVVFFHFK